MTIRMGYWDCSACGQTKVEGPNRNCPSCGTPRDEGIEFYTEDSAPEVEDQALLERAKSGGDWTCEYCSTESSALQQACSGCGAPRDGAKQRQAKLTPTAGAVSAGAVSAGAVSAGAKGAAQTGMAAAQKSQGSVKSKTKLGVVGVCLGFLAAVVFGVWFLVFRTVDVKVSVTKKTWVRAYQIEVLKTTREGRWKDEAPRQSSTVRYVRTETRQRQKKLQEGTERVKVGQKNLGNGMFEDVYENRPKYVTRMVSDTWVIYDQDRWVQGKKLKSTEDDGTEPPWPAFTATSKERIGSRSDEVVLDLMTADKADKQFTIDVSAAEGKKKAGLFEKGGQYVAKINTLGTVMDLVAPGSSGTAKE